MENTAPLYLITVATMETTAHLMDIVILIQTRKTIIVLVCQGIRETAILVSRKKLFQQLCPLLKLRILQQNQSVSIIIGVTTPREIHFAG